MTVSGSRLTSENELRQCNRCGAVKKAKKFYWQSSRGHTNVCLKCRRKYKLARKNERMGITKKPDKRCPICRRPLQKKHTHRDHDHDTGVFRDFICRYCNTILGMARDNPKTLKRAIKYLEKHRE